MMTDKDSSVAGLKPITLFIRTCTAESKIQATLLGLNNTFPFVEKIIKEYTGQRPIHIKEACFEHTKKCFEDRVIPFLDMFKIHVMHCEVTWFKNATEFIRIFDELDNAYAKYFAENQSLYAMNKRNIAKNKCLQIQKKNLLIHDESLIADCIANDDILDWVQPTLLPKKKQVTFLKPHRTSPRSTQKPPVQHKKPTVPVNMFPKAKPATEARKPIPKRNTQNHNPLPAKSVKAKRVADYYRNLYVDISQFVDRSTKSVHTKPHQAKRVVNTSTNAWNATKNTVARTVPIWKPTGRRFNLHDIFGSRMSTEPIIKPSKLTPCISSSTKIPMLSKFVAITLGIES
nr:hypothetical protein [Tanacetum cinerariifolium]